MIVQILLSILLAILSLNATYLFVFSVAASLHKKSRILISWSKQAKILVLIPAYKEDSVIAGPVKSVLSQNYPLELYKCVVLADSFQQATIEHIRSLGAEVFELADDPMRNKARSIQKYLLSGKEKFDACIVLDADNCVDPDMLQLANNYLNNGNRIIQARRVAKNEENAFSRLDSLSEIINNHIFRKGQRALGFSASLIGSGMIFEMNLFSELMGGMNVFSGFDKEMELRILKKKITIEYAQDILVYDEKISSREVFINQRRRWTHAQLYFLKKYIGSAFKQLWLEGNTDYFNKVFQFMLLPRVLCLGASLLIIPLTFFAGSGFLLASILIFFIVVSSLFIAVKDNLKRNEILTISRKLPSVFTGMIKAIRTSRQAAGKFIHTPHNVHS